VISPNYLSTTVEPSKIVEIAQKLNSMGFDHVKSVTGIDFPEEKKIDVVYHVSSFEDAELAQFILELKTSVDRLDPRIKSLIGVWPSAEFPERETTDLMGVTFDGQPEKERLMLMDNFEGGPPLRKDFKLKTEGIDA
jgi:NADH-quinone oxidoreductase subunit C